jgi:hypothetical protein
MSEQEKILNRALRLTCEAALRANGYTPLGVKAYLPSLVKRYIDMASGKLPLFYGATQ